MKKFIITALLTAVAFQAQAKEEKAPAWVNNPRAACAAKEICAVGVGSGPATAKADARNELAKIFESKIKSDFETDFRENNGHSSDRIRDFVSVSSNVILNAVEIKQTYATAEEVYALAVLNKPMAARITKDELNDLDAKMTALLTESPVAVKKIEKLYDERRGINRRYTLLTGHGLPEKVAYDQIAQAGKTGTGKRRVALNAGTKSLAQAVRDVMTENGYTVEVNAITDAPIVTVTLDGEQQYSKIDGFVKYDYHFTMKAPDKSGKNVDVLSATFSETGRNERQAYRDALESLKSYLNENIDSLNL